MKKAVLFVPFWGQPGHVGNNRVDRFIRWLAEDGFYVAVIKAGGIAGQRDTAWGQEITVRDPLGLYRVSDPSGNCAIPRKPSKLRRTIAYMLLNPDPTIVWAQLAAGHPAVVRAAREAKFVLSSSPPESALVGGWKLSRLVGIPHFVDMRDGWLDEPLKPLLHNSTLRRWREERIEKRILKDASAIQVTSEVWQELLCTRMPELKGKVKVLTNEYPPHIYPNNNLRQAFEKKDKQSLVLIHAGQFLGSDVRRRPNLLLTSLMNVIRGQTCRGVVQLIGRLSIEERDIIRSFESDFSENGWVIECPGSVPRSELLQRLLKADGLLQHSTSYAAVPSKLFEYIPTGKPIFVVTEQNSATWRICERLPQVFLSPTDEIAPPASSKFIIAIQEGNYDCEIPEEYSDGRGSAAMLETIKSFG